MLIHIRNMVCPRCISSVKRIVSSFGFTVTDVKLGECTTEESLNQEQMEALSDALQKEGFEILMGKDLLTVDQIKRALIELVYNSEEDIHRTSVPEYLQERTNQSYSALRKTFVQVEGRTIDKYLIGIRIERAKELLKYDDMSLAQIAESLGYSSSAHLSAQFKQLTGITPREFKSNSKVSRLSIDSI